MAPYLFYGYQQPSILLINQYVNVNQQPSILVMNQHVNVNQQPSILVMNQHVNVNQQPSILVMNVLGQKPEGTKVQPMTLTQLLNQTKFCIS